MSFGAKRLCDPELIRERSIMREHLFRGKLKNKEKWMDKGEWIEGSLLCYDVEGMIACRIIESLLTGGREARAIAYEVDPETVCEYTGEIDKNNRRIFENDITKLVLSNGEVRYFRVSFKKVVRKVLCHPDFDDDIAKVELNAVCFEWNGYELFPCIDDNGVSDASKMEVVGNIFDDPELM